MRDPKKKCICKKCEDCQFNQFWNMTDDHGSQKTVQKCSLQVLFDEIPRIRGSVDGLQAGVNETRNQSIKVVEIVGERTKKFVESLEFVGIKLLGGKSACQ